MQTYKPSQQEELLLEPLKDNIARMMTVQAAFPSFGIPLVGILVSAAVKSIALSVATAESGTRDLAARGKQLDFMLQQISETYASELLFLDKNPEFLDSIRRDAAKLRSLIDSLRD